MSKFIPYGRQSISEEDIQAVAEVLRGDFITTGPKVDEFEKAVADYAGSEFGISVTSGTAALHTAMFAAGIGPGDEVIVPPITFAATANSVLYMGGAAVFADVCEDTLLIDPDEIRKKITSKTKAVAVVDFAGQPCDYDEIRKVTDEYGLILIADSCHSLGAEYKGGKCGSIADITLFSFHPVKHITTGEGGMAVTDKAEFADRMKRFRNHGINVDYKQREKMGSWYYEMTDLGYNYRMTDFQCALGLSQLKKLDGWVERRQQIAKRYDQAFADVEGVEPLSQLTDRTNAYHLYVVKITQKDRAEVFASLRDNGIGVNVHYIPVHLHPYYRDRFGYGPGLCPVAERAYEQIISLPMFPGLTDGEVGKVIGFLLSFV